MNNEQVSSFPYSSVLLCLLQEHVGEMAGDGLVPLLHFKSACPSTEAPSRLSTNEYSAVNEHKVWQHNRLGPNEAVRSGRAKRCQVTCAFLFSYLLCRVLLFPPCNLAAFFFFQHVTCLEATLVDLPPPP